VSGPVLAFDVSVVAWSPAGDVAFSVLRAPNDVVEFFVLGERCVRLPVRDYRHGSGPSFEVGVMCGQYGVIALCPSNRPSVDSQALRIWGENGAYAMVRVSCESKVPKEPTKVEL
jgi:hypothetical protein